MPEAVDAYRALASVAWVRDNLWGKNPACRCAPDAPCAVSLIQTRRASISLRQAKNKRIANGKATTAVMP
jgi:hypothetical protein